MKHKIKEKKEKQHPFYVCCNATSNATKIPLYFPIDNSLRLKCFFFLLRNAIKSITARCHIVKRREICFKKTQDGMKQKEVVKVRHERILWQYR